jgi:hypothetical protein
MFRFLADENFNADIERGLLLRQQNLDVVNVLSIGLGGASDSEILAWAAANDRLVLTHDRATMPRYAYERLQGSKTIPGVFIIDDRLPVGRVIQEILLVVECSEFEEWIGQVVYLPL